MFSAKANRDAHDSNPSVHAYLENQLDFYVCSALMADLLRDRSRILTFSLCFIHCVLLWDNSLYPVTCILIKC